MLVLGHAERIKATEPWIVVPPFHTGHLGFVPDTPIRIDLVDTPKDARHHELMVTPFDLDLRDLAVVTVGMKDRAGVVGQLIKAVAALGINIEIQESSSINLLDNHSVSLLVNLSGAAAAYTRPEPAANSIPSSPPAVRRLYQGYDALFPVRDLRCVLLFESIVTHCADVILWRDIAGEPFPDIEIRPCSGRPVLKTAARTIASAGERGSKVKIDLPEEIINCLRPVQGPTGEFEYLLVSDTNMRALHIFLLHPDLARNLFHVAFFHDDVPGALATILTLLRDAGFNILTSLMRKRERGRSVWEVVMEYQGDRKDIPLARARAAHLPIKQRELSWICDRIADAHKRNRREVTDCRIAVGPPLYPKHKATAGQPRPAREIELEPMLTPTRRRSPARQGDGLLDLLRYRLASPAAAGLAPTLEERAKQMMSRVLRVQEEPIPGPVSDGRTKQLLKRIQQRHLEGGRSGVFLSYPRRASRHGELLAERLDDLYRVVRYQEADGEVIIDEVIRKIEDSDYFIGIWHHEGSRPWRSRTKRLSPWMMFEYGIAHAAGKPAIVVHSDKLDPEIWRRINPSVANPEYRDKDFEATVDMVLDYCERHFF